MVSAVPEFITSNPKLLQTLELADRIAKQPIPVLILGESGTGKEVIANRIHAKSGRRGAFVPIDCGAIHTGVLDSELFGHEDGSFTSAKRRRSGLIEEANAGTAFLDEIGDMPQDVQVKLLRFLQNGTIRRVGGNTNLPVDVRVIAATHRDLIQGVNTKKFRLDLYFRLNVVTLRIPPLRERRDDIPLLIQHFSVRSGLPVRPFDEDAISYMRGLTWNGNARELENVVTNLLATTTGPSISLEDVVSRFEESVIPPQLCTLEEAKLAHIHKVMEWTKGNKMAAARILGVNVKTLYNILHRPAVKETATEGVEEGVEVEA